MRAAAARAASRRGSRTNIFLPSAHGSSASTSGTRVVLPAPGGATSTAQALPFRAAVSSGSAASMGRGGLKRIGRALIPSPLEGEGGARSAPGEGSLSRMFGHRQYQFEHTVRIVENIVVPDTYHAVANASQRFVAPSIFCRLEVLASVDFDNDLRVVANEIDDVALN